jgi:hypothetical protein
MIRRVTDIHPKCRPGSEAFTPQGAQSICRRLDSLSEPFKAT